MTTYNEASTFKSQLDDLARRLKIMETAARLSGSSLGTGQLSVSGTGTMLADNGGIIRVGPNGSVQSTDFDGVLPDNTGTRGWSLGEISVLHDLILRNASIKDGTLQWKDAQGVLRIEVGKLSDGTFGMREFNTQPPPMPSKPFCQSQLGGYAVTWDGNNWDGTTTQPLDWSRTEIHSSPVAIPGIGGFTPSNATLRGVFNNPAGGVEVCVAGPEVGYVYEILLLSVNRAGTVSLPSERAQIQMGGSHSAPFSFAGMLTARAGAHRWYNDLARTVSIGKIRASVGIAPTGTRGVTVDVLKNGSTSIFRANVRERPNILPGKYSDVGTPDLGTTMIDGDYLTVNVVGIGSVEPGSDLTVSVTIN